MVEARVAGRKNVGTSVRACNCVYMTDSQAAERRQIYVAPMELTLLLSPLINTLLRTCLRSVDPLRGTLSAKAYGKADSDPPPQEGVAEFIQGFATPSRIPKGWFITRDEGGVSKSRCS